ncbi:RsmB/NOP family class I SAM-dependent RNA methyltransferase [Waddlia chondrophila]|uniref:Putative ribosomal RNA small subunit methyltransferase B n=1 Tax=Waddlia chondrophila (strain ATCC VR-1470 / WSU 86-1044) TaxID=716544 RepID=D6YS19_WADCW|nr:RsmB/NOP family class I SAM-dependent RNA methyltransferase [Waddlia chondrophila]ADI38864.1 putative ribosomal RNA small subunit methyltransferase B [Waddlia chondrophila WSU 86-1044]
MMVAIPIVIQKLGSDIINRQPFRNYHLLRLLKSYEGQEIPLDLCIHRYFKENRSLGSKDRAEIAENIYGMIRWLPLINHLSGTHSSWEKRLETWTGLNPEEYRHNSSIPSHIRYSFPKVLYDLCVAAMGKEKAEEICWECNSPAPTTVRVNRLKATRDKLLKTWGKEYQVAPCEEAKEGIRFLKKINFFQLPEFQSGYFEVQDEGSQLLAAMVEALPGQKVLDYCSGSGGKTLAFAQNMDGKGQIYLHDIRTHILSEAKRRLKRAGIQNAQLLMPDDPKKKNLKKKFDWVLVDAPCSGTGTLRRNPDMKWKFSEEMLKRLLGQQRTIFEQALSYVKPGGKIVYGTCSILKQENQDQVAHFLNTYPIKLHGDIFQSYPAREKMDGFFGACFQVD